MANNLIRKRLQHRCFLVRFANLYRSSFALNNCEQLRLTLVCINGITAFLKNFLKENKQYVTLKQTLAQRDDIPFSIGSKKLQKMYFIAYKG